MLVQKWMKLLTSHHKLHKKIYIKVIIFYANSVYYILVIILSPRVYSMEAAIKKRISIFDRPYGDDGWEDLHHSSRLGC